MVPQEKIYSITTSSWKLYYEFHGWEVRIKATGQSVSFSDRLLNANSRTHRTVGAAYIWLQYEADGYMDLHRNGRLLEELLQVMFSSQHTNHHQIRVSSILENYSTGILKNRSTHPLRQGWRRHVNTYQTGFKMTDNNVLFSPAQCSRYELEKCGNRKLRWTHRIPWITYNKWTDWH